MIYLWDNHFRFSHTLSLPAGGLRHSGRRLPFAAHTVKCSVLCFWPAGALWALQHPPGPWVHIWLTICSWEMGPKDEDATSSLSQPWAIWAEKSGVLSTWEHGLGGGRAGHVSGPSLLCSAGGDQSKSPMHRTPPAGACGQEALLVLRATHKEASFKEPTFTFKIHFSHLISSEF